MNTDDQIKRATMQIRKLAKRGTNAKLEELVRGLYTAGIEHGMRAMANQLKERLNGSYNTQHEPLEGVSGMDQHETAVPESEESPT